MTKTKVSIIVAAVRTVKPAWQTRLNGAPTSQAAKIVRQTRLIGVSECSVTQAAHRELARGEKGGSELTRKRDARKILRETLSKARRIENNEIPAEACGMVPDQVQRTESGK